MITALAGANYFLIEQKLRNLKADYLKNNPDVQIETLQAISLSTDDLYGLLAGATLFSAKRFVILRSLGENKELAEQFLAIADKLPDELTLILVDKNLDKRTQYYKYLNKNADLQVFEELDENALTRWIIDYTAEVGGKISQADARFLVERGVSDQTSLSHEIEKLVLYQPEVSRGTILNLVEEEPKETVFTLLDQAFGGRQSQALLTLERLERSHQDPYQIFNLLIWQVNILTIVKTTKGGEGELAKTFGINPYVVKKSLNLSRNLEMKKLKQVVSQLAEADIKLKTVNPDPWRLLEKLILTF